MIGVGRHRRRRSILSRALARDDGTTLMELVVGMVIMTIFGGMFTTVVVMMNKAENKAEAVNSTSAQIDQAFIALDKTVRYASAISTPGCSTSPCLVRTSGNDWYVEMQTTQVVNGPPITSTVVCTQYRLEADVTAPGTWQLQKRTWVPPAAPISPAAFVQVASGLGNGGVAPDTSATHDQPFALSALPFGLTINLASTSGSGSTQTSSKSSFTFAAINSAKPVATDPLCQEGGGTR